MTNRVGVDFLLNNSGQKGSRFLRIGPRDKVFPAFSLCCSTAPPVGPPGCLELSPVVFSGVFLMLVV